MKILLKAVVAFFILVSAAQASEYKNYDVDRILSGEKEASGVVFEIISWDKDAWDWAAPMLKQFREQLLEKNPDLDIAMVSHGGEQFELTKDKAEVNAVTFEALDSLSKQGVDLHVCGTHSGWRNVDESEYVDFIDVSPSGPAQINDYIKLGYTHILLNPPY